MAKIAIMSIKPLLSGSCQALFVHFFRPSMAIFFRFRRHLFLRRFSSSFFFLRQHEYGLHWSSPNSIISCWFHPSSPCCGAKKRMKMKKKIDGCRRNFNYGSEANTKSIKGGGMKKKKSAGKSLPLFPHFMRERNSECTNRPMCKRSTTTNIPVQLWEPHT